MFKDSDYKLLAGESGGGSYSSFGIRILVAGSKLPDLDQKAIRYATYDAIEKLKAEIMGAAIAADPTALENAANERANLIGLFPALVFVESIPNGYCSSYCCRHLPWFVVTTKVGRFKIGRRKRVIHVEWTETVGTKTTKDLFAAEDVTKDDKMIHAWSLDKAREYIKTVLETASI